MCLRLIRKIRDFQTIFSSFQISQVVNNKYLLLLLCTPKAKNTLPDKWKRREMKKNYEDDSKLCWYKSKSITWNSLSWNYSFYTVEEKEYYVYAMLILKKNHEDHSTKRNYQYFNQFEFDWYENWWEDYFEQVERVISFLIIVRMGNLILGWKWHHALTRFSFLISSSLRILADFKITRKIAIFRELLNEGNKTVLD